MAKNKEIDWELVEDQYRAGQLSIREIARRAGCADSSVRKKAKKEGWSRDLSEKIRKAVRSELVRSEVRTAKGPASSEKEVVEAAVNIGVEIELLQRKDIAALRKLEAKFLKELNSDPTKLYITQHQGKIIQRRLGLTVSEKATTLSNLTNVMQRRIDLERRAYNLDDGAVLDNDRMTDFGKVQLSESLMALVPVPKR